VVLVAVAWGWCVHVATLTHSVGAQQVDNAQNSIPESQVGKSIPSRDDILILLDMNQESRKAAKPIHREVASRVSKCPGVGLIG
jgi:hypothetical protein